MKTSLCLLVFILFGACLQAQNVYYVAPNGNDNSVDPKNINTPWQSFHKACTTASPGDKVFFRGGIYNQKGANCTRSGNAAQYIEYLNYAGEQPIFDGGNTNISNEYFLNFTNTNYVRIKGINFRNLTGNGTYGIKVMGDSHHFEIIKCQLSAMYSSPNPSDTDSNTSNPILILGSNVANASHHIKIDSCTVSNCRTGYSEAITVVGNVEQFIVSNNHINNTGNIGIIAAGYYEWGYPGLQNIQTRKGIIRGNLVENCKSLRALAAGIYIDGAREVIVEQNICRGGQRGFQINCENHFSVANAKADKNIIRNNLAYNNSRGGIGLGACSGTPWCTNGKVTNSWIINNTSINNNDNSVLEPLETEVQDYGELNLDYSENCVIRNNIFYSSISGRSKLMNSYQGSSSFVINLLSDYNIWFNTYTNMPEFMFNKTPYYGLSNFQQNTSQDLHSVFQDPGFVDVSNSNFRLSSGNSTAFDFGDPAIISIDSSGLKDLAYKPRMKNFKPDAGAFELQCLNSNVTINTPLYYKSYLFETSQSIFVNTSINSLVKVILNAKKAVVFNPITNTFSNIVIQTKNDGCTN